jgi:hypothetical protein
MIERTFDEILLIEIAITIRHRLLSHESIITLNRMRFISRSFRINSASIINQNLISTIHSIQNNEILNILSAINSHINTMLINHINLNHRLSQTQNSWKHRDHSCRLLRAHQTSSLSSRSHIHRVSTIDIKKTIAKNTIDEIH